MLIINYRHLRFEQYQSRLKKMSLWIIQSIGSHHGDEISNSCKLRWLLFFRSHEINILCNKWERDRYSRVENVIEGAEQPAILDNIRQSRKRGPRYGIVPVYLQQSETGFVEQMNDVSSGI